MPSAVKMTDIATFQEHLIGTWTNQDFPGTSVGGTDNPLSYNVMPLPQTTPQPGQANYSGFILKNFTYWETITFNGMNATSSPVNAPNRGGTYLQNCYALFYDQKVFFAEGPGIGTIVHEENGSWLSLVTAQQGIGPYNKSGLEPGPVVPQPADITIAKQISVPHGNSVLALGSYQQASGAPVIADAASIFPTPDGLNTSPYTETLDQSDNYQNPQPNFTLNTNLPLQQAVAAIEPNNYIHMNVTTKQLKSGKGQVTNIPFEQRRAKVTDYTADYWLLSTDEGNTFKYLAYTQHIILELAIGKAKYSFPHNTSNTVTKAS